MEVGWQWFLFFLYIVSFLFRLVLCFFYFYFFICILYRLKSRQNEFSSVKIFVTIKKRNFHRQYILISLRHNFIVLILLCYKKLLLPPFFLCYMHFSHFVLVFR